MYQSMFQLVKIILPIITIPIVSNALGPDGIGIYNYTNSIAQYFVLVSGLGVGVYGNREIARVRDDQDNLSIKFWELFWLSFVVSIFSLALYYSLVSFSSDKFFFYLQGIIIVASVFDVSWFFMGIEDFKKVSLSNICSQLLSFLGIIFFVRTKNDLWIYILIQSANILFSQCIMWFFIKDKIKFIKVKYNGIIKHFIPSLQYFIPKIAIILYTNLNKTLLGYLDTKVSVGFYSNALMMNSILVTLITTLDLVLLPKFSNSVAKGNTKYLWRMIKKSIHFQIFITIPMMFGILLITPKLVPWFFGESFFPLINMIPIISPLVIIMPLGMAIGRQYLIPMDKVKTYNIAVILGAIVSIVLNLILIPHLKVYGALIATLTAETFVTATRFRAFKKETQFVVDYKYMISCLFSAAAMYFSISYVTSFFEASFFTTILQIILGFFVYMIITTLIKINPIMELLKTLNKNNEKLK